MLARSRTASTAKTAPIGSNTRVAAPGCPSHTAVPSNAIIATLQIPARHQAFSILRRRTR
jgi:hypothetical protein